MSLFEFFRPKKPPAVTYRLTWFELQVMPFTYRFAILPQQPILIGGLEATDGGKGVTMLIRYSHVPLVYERTVERVDALLRKHGITEMKPDNPEMAFATHLLNTPGVHLRFSYADNTRWAAMYAPDELPPAIAAFLAETKTLARQIRGEMSHETISGEKAYEHLNPELNQTAKHSPGVIVRVKVTAAGAIFANQRSVSVAELGVILDELKAKEGVVWYHREAPMTEPAPAVLAVVRQVLDAVVNRQLAVQLQQEEF